LSQVCVWSVSSGNVIFKLSPQFFFEHQQLSSVCFSPDNRYLAVGTASAPLSTQNHAATAGGVISIFDLDSREVRAELSGFEGSVTFLTFLENGRLVAHCTDGVIRIFAGLKPFLASGRRQTSDLSGLRKFNFFSRWGRPSSIGEHVHVSKANALSHHTHTTS
jgi:WD40 repeat protein